MSHRHVFSSGLFSLRKEESQEGKDDRAPCVWDDLEEPVTFDLSVLSVLLG